MQNLTIEIDTQQKKNKTAFLCGVNLSSGHRSKLVPESHRFHKIF